MALAAHVASAAQTMAAFPIASSDIDETKKFPRRQV
jgi:hypothetical protein